MSVFEEKPFFYLPSHLMKATIHHTTGDFEIDFSKPIDISIPTEASLPSSRAWYVDPIEIEIVRTEQFVGSVAEGGTTNFRNISFNPHGNTTHTECVGHIAEEVYSINEHLTNFFFRAQLITITPEQFNGLETDWQKKEIFKLHFRRLKNLLPSKWML